MKWNWTTRILLLAAGLLLLLALLGEDPGHMLLGKRMRERQALVDSYNREATAGRVPMPAHIIRVSGVMLDKSPIEIEVMTPSGETQSFVAVKLDDGSGTNWGFMRE